MSNKYSNESLLEKLAKGPYNYKVGPFKVESPFEVKVPIKRKDTRAFVVASGAGYLASKYNRARINNGKEVGDFGRFIAENPGTTMFGANAVAGLGSAGKNIGQEKWKNHKMKEMNPTKLANEERSEFEKYASHGFLTSQETQGRFLESHKPSDLALVKLAFALEACGELDKIDHLIEDGGSQVLDDYMKVAYDVCSEGIEKQAGKVRSALVNGAAGFLSGGATNLMGYIPNAVTNSALDKVYNAAGTKATDLANKGVDAGIDKMLDFEDQMRSKKVKAAKAAQVNSQLNNLSGMPKAASYNQADAQAEVDKLDQAFLTRDSKTKASQLASEYEKVATEKRALNSLFGNKVTTYLKEQQAMQEVDDYMSEGDVSDLGLEDEIKIANDPEIPEDSLESAVGSMALDEPLDLGAHDVDDGSIWSEDPADLIN